MSSAWQSYRYWARLRWILFFGMIVWFFAVAIVSEAIGHWNRNIGHGAYFAGMGAWMLPLLYANWRANNFRCPRCNQYFFRTLWYYNGFARKCVHCGLPKWADP